MVDCNRSRQMPTAEVMSRKMNVRTCGMMKLKADVLPPVVPVTDHLTSMPYNALRKAMM